MDNIYSYDKMQNITNLSNIAPAGDGSDGFGGLTTQNYTYDNIYQLTNANGSWLNRQGHEHKYTLDMGYDTIGNIKTKNQNHIRIPNDSDTQVEQKATSYDWTYTHNTTQPHAPTKIGERTFTYDANGNQLGWQSTQNNNHRTIVWDEENHITSISDNGQTSYYVYDAGGERILKKGKQGETFYVNAYFVIREGQVASKHFFAGSQRVATKLTKQESQTVHGKGTKPPNIIYEKEQYFYHPDHLGSSSFVTDETGKVFEHIEYFPYGELFGHEHSNTQITPYRFTGKEYDEVTGLYYYGARYYDPRTSVWQSVDPIIGEYMSGKTNGGVFNPKNLSLFGYTYGNPVNLVDFDGEATYSSDQACMKIAFGVVSKNNEASARATDAVVESVVIPVGNTIAIAWEIVGPGKVSSLVDYLKNIIKDYDINKMRAGHIGGKPKEDSPHAKKRKEEGRLTGTSYNDVQKARKSDMQIQDDGRIIVRGSNGREHIFEEDGELVTTINQRSKKSAQNKTDRRAVSWAEYEKIQDMFK